MREIMRIDAAPAGHWVGDGFPVRSLLSHHLQGEFVSPFLLLDYAGTATFFLLTLMALIDVIAGFAISLFAARRDFAIEAEL